MLAVVPDAVPEPAVAPPPGHPRFALFDGLRAIAAFSIVVTHASGITTFGATDDVIGPLTARLNAGVAAFFVISGFLLYRPFVLARFSDRPAPGTGRYLWRRVLRIVPAFWVAMVVLELWPGLNNFPGDQPWRYFLFGQNLDRFTLDGGIGPAWSLCIEAEFYVVLPLWAYAARRLRPSARAELTAFAVLAVASVLARTLVHAHAPVSPLSYTLPLNLFWFAPGLMLAVLSAQWQASGHKPRPARWLGDHAWVCWAAALAVLILSANVGLPRDLLFRYSDRTWLAEHVLYGVFGALLVLPGVVGDGHRGWVQAFLGHRVMAWLGLISYGVFLYHLPVAPKLLGIQDDVPLPFVAYTAALTAVAIAYGAASYYLLERPILKYKDVRR